MIIGRQSYKRFNKNQHENKAVIANVSINFRKESSKYNMLFVQSYERLEEDGLLE
jgi:hypothetical protein